MEATVIYLLTRFWSGFFMDVKWLKGGGGKNYPHQPPPPPRP